MKQFNVTGMSCAACSARVEKAVSSVEGVTSCAVSLLTNSMGVEGTASDEAIIKAVTEAGYGASPEKENDSVNKADELKDRETPKLIRRLIISVILLLPLMYVSMGHMMWGFPLPAFLHESYLARGVFQMILSAAVLIVNRRFFINGLRGVVHGSANMDTLVAMGSGISFVYSVYLLFFKGEETGLYFESAAMILTLITVGKTLEAYSKGRTTDALKSLMTLAPETATLLVDGKETSVPVGEVKKDDVFIVRAGESVPVDGVVTEGTAAVDESALTGESIPVDKAAGDTVSAATVSRSGYIKCRATRVGKDTTLSQIIKMVSDAAATKAPIAKIADRVSGVFVPVVIGIAVITVIVWLIAGREFGYALSRGITVLVISCPCSLGLATPVAIMVGNGVGAKNGILFKTSASLEESGRIQIVALDKTGTVTEGRPVVTDVIPYGETGETELLECAYSLEKKSSHPLAKAVTDYAEERNCLFSETEDFRNSEGNGICAEYKGKESYAGNYRFISSKITLPDEVPGILDGLAAQGKTPMLFSRGGAFLGIIAVADTVRDDSAQAVRELHDMGIKTLSQSLR
ncbi:MAG: heavy metal translocating P-type ATPase, partial [Clostridia bacterium]|nr:heavy metal translocating P-type ATPase [Clostridia bacterium]